MLVAKMTGEATCESNIFSLGYEGMSFQSSSHIVSVGKEHFKADGFQLPRTKLIAPKTRELIDFCVGSTHDVSISYSNKSGVKKVANVTLTVTAAPPADLSLPGGWAMGADGFLRK